MKRKEFFMINKAFNLATLQILKSSQTVYYKINSPSLEDMAVIYKQGDELQFQAALSGFKPSNRFNNGDTLIHHFNQFFDEKVIETIIKSGKFDINAKNNNAETVLVNLAKNSSKEDNGQILNKEQIVVISDEYFERLSQINDSIKHKAVKIAECYVKNGIDVNLNDIFGNTAIYYAIKKSNFELASLIAKTPNFNPSVKFREDDYKDAFDLAVESRCLELALSIFLSFSPEEKKDKMFTLKDNLYATEALLLTCESLAVEKSVERDTETV